tara:strand:- start:627 stop:1073 length:447 start_codon:yes stop_codon:yes gene_type:complete
MANVNIKFNGKEFLLSCEDGQEEHLEELSLNFNKKFNDLKHSLGNIGESKLLLIASIKVMDEYFETKKKIEEQKIELNKITDRFRELKSLIYKYKEDKEKEVVSLSEDQTSLRNELQAHKINYESLVDRATFEIESFIKKHDTDTKVQ